MAAAPAKSWLPMTRMLAPLDGWARGDVFNEEVPAVVEDEVVPLGAADAVPAAVVLLPTG